MEPLVLLLLLILIALILFSGVKVIEDEKKKKRAIYLVLFMLAVAGLLLTMFLSFMNVKNDITPTALDVYRGKTELQVNKIYKNDSIISCDSIVVMKDNNLNSNE